MKTKRLIKVINILVIIITVVATCHPTVVNAEINETTQPTTNLLEIKPSIVTLNRKKPSALKLEIDVQKLKEIRLAKIKAEEEQRKIEEQKRIEEEKKKIVYDGMTLEELSNKLNRTLNSTLSGKGETYAKLSLEYGVDPYLAVAISMHETGCKWNCSRLVKSCNNVGGMKGSPGCGSAYASFSTLDEGIRAFISNISRNYTSKGLTTPESMGPKYAGSSTWSSQVRSYLNEIKAK